MSQPQNSAEAADVIRTLTKAQRRALDQIACGNDGGQRYATLSILERKGLIVGTPMPMHFSDGLPPMLVTRYEVPIFVHIAWYDVCGSEPDEEISE